MVTENGAFASYCYNFARSPLVVVGIRELFPLVEGYY